MAILLNFTSCLDKEWDPRTFYAVSCLYLGRNIVLPWKVLIGISLFIEIENEIFYTVGVQCIRIPLWASATCESLQRFCSCPLWFRILNCLYLLIFSPCQIFSSDRLVQIMPIGEGTWVIQILLILVFISFCSYRCRVPSAFFFYSGHVW